MLIAAATVLSLLAGLPVARAAAGTAPAAQQLPAVRVPTCDGGPNSYPVLAAHPSVPDNWCYGIYGWGKLTVDPARTVTEQVWFVTPWYSSAGEAQASDAEERLAEPVIRTGSPLVPETVDVHQQACLRLVDGSPVGYTGDPCEHTNLWSDGPDGGISRCVYKSCQTVGHGAQGGYVNWLAHREIWSYLAERTIPGALNYRPCGQACLNAPCPPGQTKCSPGPTTTVPNPKTTSTIPSCPPGAPTCPRTPTWCETVPSDPDCRVDLDGVRYEITIDVPDPLVTGGSLRPQTLRVVSVRLMCGTRTCDQRASSTDPKIGELTGRLQLASTSKTYPSCPAANCTWKVTVADDAASIRAGDRLVVDFYSPTRSGTWVVATLPVTTATVERFATIPVYDGTADRPVTGNDPGWGTRQRASTGQRTVPVVVMTVDGTVVDTGGVRRSVIGSVGG